jgi:TolA-binding protein
MKTPVLILTVALACAAGVLAGGGWRWIFSSNASLASEAPGAGKRALVPSEAVTPTAEQTAKSTVEPAVSAKSKGSVDLESRMAALETAVAALQKSGAALDARRVAALERNVKELQSAMDGVSVEKASADREAQFASDEGYVKANEYFEAGKFAIAGEGFITFVKNHPNHPDTREVMKKARDSFVKAGYNDKAFWVQEEMMKAFPDHMAADVHELAVIEKNAGMYDRAAQHMAQAAELAKTPEDRLWKRLYWAWYVQMRDGNPAGIAALQQVQREIATSGVKNPKLDEHAATRMREWQQQMQKQLK